MQKFFDKNKQYRVKPVDNRALRNLEVLVMEMYDRSLTKADNATVHPTDMDNMQVFWADWLKRLNKESP